MTIRDFSKTCGEDYNPAPKIKIYPVGSFGTSGIVRDKNGACIGGCNTYRIRDTNGNFYNIQITPAVYEELIKLPRPFGRSKPGRVFVKISLSDFPDFATEIFEDELFFVQYDPDEDEYYSPEFKKHEWHKIAAQTYLISLDRFYKFGVIKEVLYKIMRTYKGNSTKKWNHISNDPIPRLQYIFTFPEPWVVNRVFSPQYYLEFNRYHDGFDYAWYYGRFGVFDDWTYTQEPHPGYHTRGWDE